MSGINTLTRSVSVHLFGDKLGGSQRGAKATEIKWELDLCMLAYILHGKSLDLSQHEGASQNRKSRYAFESVRMHRCP